MRFVDVMFVVFLCFGCFLMVVLERSKRGMYPFFEETKIVEERFTQKRKFNQQNQC